LGYYSSSEYRIRSSVGFLVRRSSNLLMLRIEAAFSEHELSFSQWTVLMALRDGVARNAAELCREMSHDSGALTRVLDQLVHRGLVERRRNDDDRRSFDLSLTETGRRSAEALVPLVVNCLNRAMENFSVEDIDTLAKLLVKLADGLSCASNAKSDDDRYSIVNTDPDEGLIVVAK
jgi:DNA-binding MarR family transcriptional regulator